MIPAVKPNQMKLLLSAAGILALTLRATLYAIGVDEKGLLISGHWADRGVWVLTAVVAAVLLLWCSRLNGTRKYTKAFPASALRAAGTVLAAVSFLLSPVAQAPSRTFGILETTLRFAAAGCLIWISYCRFRGKAPQFLLHCTVCLYLALRLVCQYRAWSADPQIQNYAFYLGAHVALMLTAYQLAAMDAGAGDRRHLWGAGLAAAYLCLAAIPASKDSFFLLCCALWILTNLSCPAARNNTNHTTQEDTL